MATQPPRKATNLVLSLPNLLRVLQLHVLPPPPPPRIAAAPSAGRSRRLRCRGRAASWGAPCCCCRCQQQGRAARGGSARHLQACHALRLGGHSTHSAAPAAQGQHEHLAHHGARLYQQYPPASQVVRRGLQRC